MILKPMRTVRLGLVLGLALPLTTAPTPARAAVDLQVFANGLQFPAAFTFAPDGRVFYGERFSGQIRILSADGNTDSLFFTINGVISSGEDGVLGIALHPNYPATPHVFVYVTRNDNGPKNQIVRITDAGGSGQNMTVIFESDKEPGTYHDGGRILFGPDGKLYAVVGDAHRPSNAQRLGTTTGKILRMNPNGSVPSDNPWDGKLAFARGIRNSFGLAFDPATGRLWETENGPQCNDEVNRIPRKRNLGWGPKWTCEHPPKTPRNTNQDGRKPMLPKYWWRDTIAPTGIVFCESCGLPAGDGHLFFGDWNEGRIHRIALTADRRDLRRKTHRIVYRNNQGILSMEAAPDGTLFFSDPNGIYRLVSA